MILSGSASHVLESRRFVRLHGVVLSHDRELKSEDERLQIRAKSLAGVVGRQLQAFIRFGCASLCERCHSLRLERLRASTFTSVGLVTVSSCEECEGVYVVPQIDTWPVQLL